MKKRILCFIAVVILVLGLTAVFVACGDDELTEYTVTVRNVDRTPAQDITVSWTSSSGTAGTRKTGEDGKATASLASGSYNVVLSGYDDGLTYTSVSVHAASPNVTIRLEVAVVTYSVTVTDSLGAAAANVSVSWASGTNVVGTAVTNADGYAECEIEYGEYTVTVSDLPEGNISDGAKTVTGKNPAARFELRDGDTVRYTVTVMSEGGLLFKDQPVFVYSDSAIVATGRTNQYGVYSFTAEPSTYTVMVSALPDGYTTQPVIFSSSVRNSDAVLKSAVITSAPAADMTYVIGDIIHDYTFTTPYELNGKVWTSSVSEILKTKQMLLINNWGTQCSWCVTEMPDMQKMYEKYGDSMEIVAVSNYATPDSVSTIISFQQTNGLTFPLMRDNNGFVQKFAISGWPTTVIVDRYGAIARIERGAVTTEEAWERLIQKYIGEDYVQTFTPGDKDSESINSEISKPDITLPDDHYQTVATTLNNTDTFPAGTSVIWKGITGEGSETVWPFVLETDPDVSPADKVLCASNSGKANSWAAINATVTVPAGKVFTFDYYADTHSSDVFSAIWDGRIVKRISGSSDGWQTCRLFADITDGTHEVSFAYVKDGAGNTGKDNVFIRNVRFTELSEISESTDMLRAAAYGTITEGQSRYPYYVTTMLDSSDGYYHVQCDSLQNSDLAGEDASPMLFVNLLNTTQWSPTRSINSYVFERDDDGEYKYDCTFNIDGETRDYRDDLITYLQAAISSDVEFCVPVNKKLHDILVAFMSKVSGSKSHANEWLEACYFYSHYGDGEPVGNPILGVLPETAIPMTTETVYTADCTRVMPPFPSTIYAFTPAQSAVYKIESLLPSESSNATQIWLYDDATDPDHCLAYCGDSRVVRDGVNEHNFVLYRYLTAGHKYYLEVAFQMAASGKFNFQVTNVGSSFTELFPCSEDTYTMVLDPITEQFTGEVFLTAAIDYKLESDGYYHAVYPDGSVGSVIYLDVKYASSSALGNIPISRLVDTYVADPKDFTKLDYTVFDFRYRIEYFTQRDTSGEVITVYNPKVATGHADRTADVKRIIDSAPTSGDKAGLVPVTQEIVDILRLFIETRNNMKLDGEMSDVLDNEWLRFCWYDRTHDANNA